jgi:hypothetical protein
MLRLVATIAWLALLVYAAVDCVQTDSRRVQYLSKVTWFVLIVLVPIVGPVAWLLRGRAKSLPPHNRPISGPRGPEDDPDFLRNL